MSLGNFIKKLIKANALFGGKKIKLSGIPDKNIIFSDTATFDSGTNTIVFTSTLPNWVSEGKYFRVNAQGGGNVDQLFKIGEVDRLTKTVTIDSSEPEVGSVSDYSGPTTIDGRIWRVIDDVTIAKESPNSGNTIFNVHNFEWTELEDGSGVAQQFAEHYHDDPGTIDDDDNAGEYLFHEYTQLGGRPLVTDSVTMQLIDLGPMPVVNNNGDPVRGGGC